jgi:hypothetical protein
MANCSFVADICDLPTLFCQHRIARRCPERTNEQTRLSSAGEREGSGFAMFAPPICRRRWRNNAFPFRQIRRRRRQPSDHRSERSEQSNRATELGFRFCGGYLDGVVTA